MKEYQNLKFLKVMDAGHMVPMDVPNVALDMMKLFVTNGSFESNKQDLEKSGEDDGTCPVCPTCLERDSGVPGGSDTDDTTASNYYNPPSGTVIISYTWLIVGSLILVVSSMMVVLWMRPRRHVLTATAVRHQPVPLYELELRDTTKTSYHDNDDDNNVDVNGNHNNTTNVGTII
jgi:hypothetical protein